MKFSQCSTNFDPYKWQLILNSTKWQADIAQICYQLKSFSWSLEPFIHFPESFFPLGDPRAPQSHFIETFLTQPASSSSLVQ